MLFKNRSEAGKLLAEKLQKYRGYNALVYAIPRGGILTAYEISSQLKIPLRVVIAKKITHPSNPELAIAAVSQSSYVEGEDLKNFDQKWVEKEIQNQRKEIDRRINLYGFDQEDIKPYGKTIILVDDGVATGLTLLASIRELRNKEVLKIVVAVPVVPESTADILRKEADNLVALLIPPEGLFRGAVASYYEDFSQIGDEKVVKILQESSKTSLST